MPSRHDRCRSCRSQDHIVDYPQAIRICTTCGVTAALPPRALTFDQKGAMSPFDLHYQQPGCWGLGGPGVPAALRHADCAARSQSRTTLGKRLGNLLKFLETHCDRLGTAEMVREKARYYMHVMARASGAGMKRVKKDELLSIVSVCLASREYRLTYTFRELADVCQNVSKKDICKCYKVYQRAPAMPCSREPPVLSDVIPRYCTKLDLDFASEKEVRRCVKRIDADNILRTMNPLTKIATALNVASEGQALVRIGAVCGVSVHTITRSTARYQASQ